jgi:hypothetical protein
MRCEGENEDFTLGPGVERDAGVHPYERRTGDPLYRRLQIYTVDPGTRQADGATAVVNVPYEPLEKDHKGSRKGLKGSVFHVLPVLKNPADEKSPQKQDIDLNNPSLLLTDGVAPSPVDPRFHQQMVYAVASLVYATFRRALGRHLGWRFEPAKRDGKCARLRLRPHGRRGHAGADYDRESGEVRFGFVKTEIEPEGRAAPNGHTFSCVSHDIVTHEVTHALLDGLRSYFLEPSSADVLGFHEGFADVIALLHRFSYTEVVRAAIRRQCGDVLQSELITSIAAEFGRTTGFGGAVRTIRFRQSNGSKAGPPPPNALFTGADNNLEFLELEPAVTYSPGMTSHQMGEVLVSAILHAFARVYARKAERYLRLATGGTGLVPRGEIPQDLQDVLAEEASQLAGQFLNVCIRAIDYCPPVDLQLGEFLRAVITADLDLVPDDPWEYREAWIDAFARHRIYPRDVQSMSQDALKWEPVPTSPRLKIEELSFTDLEFNGDPACPASSKELRRRACVLGKFVAAHPDLFRMLQKNDPLLDGDDVTVPEVQSVRSSRRVGPDGQVVFDLIAEVTQTRYVKKPFQFLFRGGTTVILGPRGELRYIIWKSVGENGRVFRQRKFMEGDGAALVTENADGWKVLNPETVQFTHRFDQDSAPEVVPDSDGPESTVDPPAEG